jgi:metallo-beta-lactamase family protein
MESTYGARDHESVAGAKERLARVIRETAAKGGRVLIPAFALGRTQELVYDLHQLTDSGEIPRIPIVIDSPLALKATTVFENNTDLFDQSEPFIGIHAADWQRLFEFPTLRFIQSVEESKALNQRTGAVVIIAA